MGTNEKIQEKQREILTILIEADIEDKNGTAQKLEECGLDKERAMKILEAFEESEIARDTYKNAWNTAMNSKYEDEFSKEIAGIQEREAVTRQYFDSLNAEYALLAIANTTAPSELNDEIFGVLYERRIQENQINNPATRIAFHYYSESKAKDIRRAVELERIREYLQEYANKKKKLEIKLQAAEQEIDTLTKTNKILENAYEKLRIQHKDRLEKDEKYYQLALAQISVLKAKVKELQERGVGKTIGAKLAGVFKRKTKLLPETTIEIPDTLQNNSSEKMDLSIPSEDNVKSVNIEKQDNTNQTKKGKANSNEEWQK